MIQSEINRIVEGKANLRTAIRAKGTAPTPHQSLDDYATYINNIDLGGIMTDEVKAIVNKTATTVTVPATVTILRACCFYSCTALQEIIMLPTTPPARAFQSLTNTNNCPIYVPDESLETYQNEWQDLATRIQPLSARTITYDFTNASEDMQVIQTYESNSRTITYMNGGTVRTLTGWMTTEYDGLYLSGSTYDNLYYVKRMSANINGIYNNANGNRGLSIDTQGFNTITLNNGSSTAWTSDSFPYVENGTITVANDGMSVTITVNQGATKVDITTVRYVTISSMVFTK